MAQDSERNTVYMASFIIFDEKPAGEGFTMGFTNMRRLSEFTKIPYNTLLTHFTRKRLTWHFYEDKGIKVIRVESWEKGLQRVQRHTGEHNRNI